MTPPDLGLPYDDYQGFHAMALAQIGGQGDAAINALLPEHKIAFRHALMVGLRYFGEPAEQRRKSGALKRYRASRQIKARKKLSIG